MKINPLKANAAALVQQLEQQRGGQTLMLYKVVKTQAATPAILDAAPALQVAFVEHVIDVYAKLGTPKGGRITEWFRKNNVPTASAEIVRLLLRRELPFTDTMLCAMFKKLSRTSFLSLVQFREQMALALEKFAKKNSLSTELRKQAGQYADALAFRNVSAAKAKYWKEEWSFPSAANEKLVARIDKLLGRRFQ